MNMHKKDGSDARIQQQTQQYLSNWQLQAAHVPFNTPVIQLSVGLPRQMLN